GLWESWSAHALLLPFLEQTALSNAINFSWGPLASPSGSNDTSGYNTTATHTIIFSLVCPSDPYSGGGKQNINNYASSFGVTGVPLYYWTAPGGPPYYNQRPSGSTGLFTFAIAYGVKDCPDGTSQTIAFAEWLVGDGNGASFGNRNPPSRYRGNLM